MSDPFLGEIKLVSFNFPPKYWALCNGQTLPIAQNQALYSLLGTTFGGNGIQTFGLPNLQGRVPLGIGAGQGLPTVTWGQVGGEAQHTLSNAEMASHTHILNGSSATGNAAAPTDGVLGVSASEKATYNQTSPNTALNPGTIGLNSGGQPHNNVQPYQTLNFIIALQGIFPSRS